LRCAQRIGAGPRAGITYRQALALHRVFRRPGRGIEGANRCRVPAEVRIASDIGSAYDALAAGGVEVVVVEQSNMLIVSRKQIADAAAAKKLPTVYGYREHVEAGGLISYGVNLNSCFHRAAYYVDKILKGTKPGDLPVQFPTRLELVINLKTAKVLGLTVLPTLLARADEVIE
jgi:putative ABC transport system substrate-binding protein